MVSLVKFDKNIYYGVSGYYDKKANNACPKEQKKISESKSFLNWVWKMKKSDKKIIKDVFIDGLAKHLVNSHTTL